MRAYKFVDEFTGADDNGINIPIFGGHAGSTIPPLFSQDTAAVTMALDKIPDVDKKVQDAGTAVGRCSPDDEGSAHADEAICVQAERSSNRAVAKRSRFSTEWSNDRAVGRASAHPGCQLCERTV